MKRRYPDILEHLQRDANLSILEKTVDSTRRLAEFAANDDLSDYSTKGQIELLAEYAFEAEVLAQKYSEKPNKQHLLSHLRSLVFQEWLAPPAEVEQAAADIYYALVDAATPEEHSWRPRTPKR